MEKAIGGVIGFIFILAFGVFIGAAWLIWEILKMTGEGIVWLYDEVWLEKIWPIIITKWRDWKHIREQAKKPKLMDEAVGEATENVNIVIDELEEFLAQKTNPRATRDTKIEGLQARTNKHLDGKPQ